MLGAEFKAEHLLVNDIIKYLLTADRINIDWWQDIFQRSLMLFPNKTKEEGISILADLLNDSVENINKYLAGDYIPDWLKARNHLRIIVIKAREVIEQNKVSNMLLDNIENKMLGLIYAKLDR